MKNMLKVAPPLELLQGTHDSYCPTYDKHIFAQKDFYMARQFFVRRVCKYCLSAIDAFTMVEQVKKVNDSNEKLWVSDLVEPKLFIKLMDIECDWAIENIYDEVVEL